MSEIPVPPANAAGGPVPRFRLRQSVEAMSGSDGALYLVRAGDADLAIRDATPADRRLLELLAEGEYSTAELAGALGLDAADVENKLDDLSAAGAVIAGASSPPLESADAERFSRQLPYLAELGDERDLQRRLARARVAVVGCGGLGTWTLAGLAAAGVRRLRLVDDDRVELSNLNRQTLYSPADIGVPKVAAAAAWLRGFDERIEVETLERRVDGPRAAARAVAGADALVLAADQPPYRLARWIDSSCREHGVAFITGGQLPPLVRVGPLYIPGQTACFTCHERALRRVSADYDGYVRHLQSAPARGATVGAASGIVGSMMAMEIVHLLVGAPAATAGAALLLDLRSGETRREPVSRDNACPSCKHLH